MTWSVYSYTQRTIIIKADPKRLNDVITKHEREQRSNKLFLHPWFSERWKQEDEI